MNREAPSPRSRWLRRATLAWAAVIIINEIRGIYIFVTVGVPILASIWGWE